MASIVDQYGTAIATQKKNRVEIVERSDYRQRFNRSLNARYDAARTTDENERHWANADNLSANSAASVGIRRKLRARARYEAQENNSYAKGMILTLANDMIGTGPKLQLLTENRKANQSIESSFLRWCEEIRLAEKLRTMRVSKVVDGEAFALLTSNPRIMHDVQLNVVPIEADLIASPYESTFVDEKQEVDGIRFDEYGNVKSYHLLTNHPGSTHSYNFTFGNWIKPEKVLHVFREDRPGQKRGVTEIVTSLPLFAMLRRFTLATLAAAETAADFAAIMKTNSSATTDAVELAEDQWFDAIPLEYRAMLTLPNGWDITQLKAEHPTTTYSMFKQEVINEISRCLNMPYNVAAANSSDYNYASGRLDHQVYFKSIAVERHQWACSLLSKIFMAWLDEAMFVPGLLPDGMPPFNQLRWSWFWDAHEHVDPQKNANAQKIKLTSGTTNRKAEYAKEGLDVDQEDAESAASFGVSVEEYQQAVFKNTFNLQQLGLIDEQEIEEDEEAES